MEEDNRVLLHVEKVGESTHITADMTYNEIFSLLVSLTEAAAESIGTSYNEVLEDMKTVDTTNYKETK